MVALHIMRIVILSLTLLAWAFPLCGQEPPAVVVALDSSRSLHAADIAAVHEALALGFEHVPRDLPVGLVTFDDSARWLVEPGSDRGAVLEALRAVEPTGSTTVLYDGIVLAAQRMLGRNPDRGQRREGREFCGHGIGRRRCLCATTRSSLDGRSWPEHRRQGAPAVGIVDTR